MTLQVINMLTVAYTASPLDSALMTDPSLSIHLKCICDIVAWIQQPSVLRKYHLSHSPITLIVCAFFFHTLDPSKPTKSEL